jgi:hypothetical protein
MLALADRRLPDSRTCATLAHASRIVGREHAKETSVMSSIVRPSGESGTEQAPRTDQAPRSRRSLLLGTAGALAGLGLAALGRPQAARAAAGDPLTAGVPNNAGTAGTSIFTDSTSPAFTALNFGQGDAFRAIATHPDRYGLWATSAFTVEGDGSAVRADGGPNGGVLGTSSGVGRAAVQGIHASAGGVGVEGQATSSGGGSIGVRGRTPSAGGTGVEGIAESSSGRSVGVSGESLAIGGTGVRGIASGATGRSRGVTGEAISPAGIGVVGRSSALSPSESGGVGVRGESAALAGVWGESEANDGIGVVGRVPATTSTDPAGVYGDTIARSGAGVEGWSRASTGTTYGVYGTSSSSGGVGVRGTASASGGNSYGVYGDATSPAGLALFGLGDARVTGDLVTHGLIEGAAAAYRVDHPTAPVNRVLRQALVGSDQWKNIYDGIAVLNNAGNAVVTLPSWFSRLNRDSRIQLTPVGVHSPVFVSQKVTGNTFRIGGGAPDQEVYWQVTGVRRDRWASAHPLRVEQNKRGREAGRLLHPEERGAAASRGVTEAFRLRRRRRRVR